MYANKLKIGEAIETGIYKDGCKNLILKVADNIYIDLYNIQSGVFFDDLATEIKGKKVDFEIRLK